MSLISDFRAFSAVQSKRGYHLAKRFHLLGNYSLTLILIYLVTSATILEGCSLRLARMGDQGNAADC